MNPVEKAIYQEMFYFNVQRLFVSEVYGIRDNFQEFPIHLKILKLVCHIIHFWAMTPYSLTSSYEHLVGKIEYLLAGVD